jgi:hypothetical protein
VWTWTRGMAMDTALIKLALLCAAAIVATALVVAGTLHVVRKGGRRAAIGCIGSLWAMTFVALSIVTGVSRNEIGSWLMVVAAGLVSFPVALVWTTYWGPALRGTTWEDMMKSARAATKKAKKSDDSRVNDK